MSTRTVEQVDSWGTVPFSGGYEDLHGLADSDFSGAVIAGPARLFMLNGNVVGILDGSIEDFETASGTAREAPHPSLPLLAVMQARAEEVRAKYYTEETPLEEVDQTLSSGGFTGFIELSENVLSGDYYQVYHQGRSMSVAWVGNSEQLITEDEAFEQANGEVGIYEVRQVDIDIIDIPSVPDTGGGASDPHESGTEEQSSASEDTASSPVPDETDAGNGQEQSTAAAGTDPVAKMGTTAPSGPPEAATAQSGPPEGTTDQDGDETATERDSGTTAAADTTRQSAADTAGVDSTQQTSGQSASAVDLETRSIPSLDPEYSEAASASTPDIQPEESTRSRTQSTTSDARQSSSKHPAAPAKQESGPPRQAQSPDQGSDQRTDRQQASQLESDLEASKERVAKLETALDDARAEQEQLREERDALADKRDELQSELETAQAEIERLEAQIDEMVADDPTAGAETRLSTGEAIDGTNLFVRYHSKGDATLEAVHSGNAEQSAVEGNLRLEFHTQFDAETAAVADQGFEAFLTGSIQYRFVDWLVRNLLYEIRETGNPDAMGDLYDALPKIDRAELNGHVSVEYTEDGEQHRTQEQFDVVVRDRMGNPLIVANINNSRDPATDDMMTDLITRAERVGSSSDSLAGAFLVTESFFEPPALETAEEATSSGLLSRDKRKSFINLSRTGGYHLCLVEARNDEFHLAVPEL